MGEISYMSAHQDLGQADFFMPELLHKEQWARLSHLGPVGE